MTKDCPFCNLQEDRIVFENESIIALWDSFPVSPGHLLLIPKLHVPTWSEASDTEQAALFQAIAEAQRRIEMEFRPDAYNIGINSGKAAGQTIPHLHVHVIPRYQEDVADPRGGVRCVIPDKADYWSKKK